MLLRSDISKVTFIYNTNAVFFFFSFSAFPVELAFDVRSIQIVRFH